MRVYREEVKVFAYRNPIDMRCSFNGLIAATKKYLQSEPLSGDVYLFFNRGGDLVKMLWWDRTGYCVLGKRLEQGKFRLRRLEEKQELSHQELELLLDGVFFKRNQSEKNMTEKFQNEKNLSANF